MGLVDMTSSGSRIVLENSLGACSRLSTRQASNPTPFARPTRPHLLPHNSSLPLVLSFHISSLPVFAGYNSSTSPNPPPKSMASQISMVAAEYQVRAITVDQFIVIYTRGSSTVKAWLARFLRMFNSSTNEWVAGLDVEYTIVLEREKILKEAERKKPAVIQVCVHNICLVYHICHADVECEEFKNFLGGGIVKFVTVDLRMTKKSWVGRPCCRPALRSPKGKPCVLLLDFNADPGSSHD